MTGKKIIELKDVCYAYNEYVALRYITFDVEKGQTIVLEGPNGCGKSTLLRLINGLLYPDEGSYRFEGQEITKESMKKSSFSKWFHQRVGFVFQNSDVQLFCPNVEEEIAFGPSQMGLSEEEVKKRTDDVIALLGIDKLKERAPYHLSGGEKKKVAIACILSMNPEVLVLDEPLAGLDRPTQDWLIDFLLKLKKAGRTMIIATHNEELAEKLGDRHIFFNDRHEAEELQVFYHTHRHCHVLHPGNSEVELVNEGIEHHAHSPEEEDES